MPGSLYALAASYDSVDEALAAYEAIDVAWHHVSSSHAFDATVVARDADGKVDIVERHDEPMRRGTTAGLGYGFAFGAVAALFPAVGILGALAVGSGAGAALGAMAGHAARVMSRDDLKLLGDGPRPRRGRPGRRLPARHGGSRDDEPGCSDGEGARHGGGLRRGAGGRGPGGRGEGRREKRGVKCRSTR